MRLISFNDKKQKLNEYWLDLVDRCENDNAVSAELTNAIAELNNPYIDADIFKIWLDVFQGSLINPATKNFIKVEISGFICDKVEWSSWIEENSEKLDLLQEFIISLVRVNSKFGSLLWKFVFKYIDLACTQIFRDQTTTQAQPGCITFPKELKNFENISYILADYEFSNYRDLKSFIDTSLIRNLDNELSSSKDQHIIIKGEIKKCVQAIFERLPSYSVSSDLYYGYREKAKVRKGFFMDPNNAKDPKLFKYIEFADALDDFVINRLCDCNSAMTPVLKTNSRIVEYLSDLVYRCSKASPGDIRASFSAHLNQYSLIHLPNYKIILTNLFVLIKKNPDLEAPFINYLLNFMVLLDSEVSSSKRNLGAKKKLDFCFRLFFAYVNQKLSAGDKVHKNKDLFINYMLKIRLSEARDHQLDVEKAFSQIFELFFNKIINLEKPGLIQYLVLFAVSSDIKPTMHPDFDNLKQLFMHKNVLILFDAKISAKIKENVLCYMYSFLHAIKIKEKNIFSIIYYSVQLLSKITKRITKKLDREHANVNSIVDFGTLKERTKTDFLNYFNKGLFCKLVAFLTKSLSSFGDELKTQHMIDLVDLFEKYFVRYQAPLEILINGNQEFYNTCCKLNKIIKDPKLCELIEQSGFTVRRERNLSSLSNNAEYYMMDSPVNKRETGKKSVEPYSFNFTQGLSSPRAHLNGFMVVNQLNEDSEESPEAKKINMQQSKFLSPSRRSLYTSTVSFQSKISITEQKRIDANLWDFELNLDPFKHTEALFYQEFISKIVCCREASNDNKFSLQDTDHSLMFTPVLGKRNDIAIGRSVEF